MSRSSEPLLLETIAIRDGVPQRLDLHQQRVDRSRRELLNTSTRLLLDEHIVVPDDMRQGLVKCRVLYDINIHRIESAPYNVHPIEGIAIATLNDIEYSHKFGDRALFRSLEGQALNRVVIVEKQGFITDSTYANLAFYDGERWVTPSHYLLNGVMRRWLLDRGMIEEQPVRFGDLQKFESVKLINAMLEFDESPVIPLTDITPL